MRKFLNKLIDCNRADLSNAQQPSGICGVALATILKSTLRRSFGTSWSIMACKCHISIKLEYFWQEAKGNTLEKYGKSVNENGGLSSYFLGWRVQYE